MPMKMIWGFFKGTLTLVAKGSRAYYVWVSCLLVLIGIGVLAYIYQMENGLIVTAMRQGPTRRGLRELERLFAVSRRTIARWELWWADVFPNTAFWRGLRTRLRARSEASSPGWLLRSITIHASPAVLSCLLRCLAGQSVATGIRGR